MANFEETQNQNLESDGLKFAIPEKGYGVYLKGILPEDQRVLAGAFSTSMQQITNISQVQLEKFAQAAYSNENMFGLNLVNGTEVPTDVRLARISQDICAVGGGVYGTFTMSNFFGAMSGLPYPLREIYNGIKQLETDTLKTIYQNLYLIIKWEIGTVNVQTSYDPDTGLYTVTGITLASQGGGYGRAGAAAPTITLSNGGTGTTVIGTDPDDLNTFGKIQSVTLTSAGSPSASPPSATVAEPPGTNPYVDNAGYNLIIQGYIDAANAEILAITTSSPSNFQISNVLNTNWDITGKALKQEQRARYISIAPVPIPFDQWIATYPTSQYVFVDGIPTLAANTLPHMYAQTLENISDLDFTGGQSVIAMMRESRNEERLNRAGLELDNNLASDMSDQDKEQLLANGTLPGAIGDEGINGYTIPVYPGDTPTTPVTGETVGIPVPVSYYDPCLPGLMCYNEIQYVQADPTAAILSAPAPEPDIPFEDLPATPEGYEPPESMLEVLPSGTDAIVPDQSFPCEGARIEPIYGAKPAPVATALIGTGAAVACDPPVDYPVGVNQPPEIIPPNLDGELTSSTLLPSTPPGGYTAEVQQAINKVIACNCDCWVA
jgi:hypothetical protein